MHQRVVMGQWARWAFTNKSACNTLQTCSWSYYNIVAASSKKYIMMLKYKTHTPTDQCCCYQVPPPYLKGHKHQRFFNSDNMHMHTVEISYSVLYLTYIDIAIGTTISMSTIFVISGSPV